MTPVVHQLSFNENHWPVLPGVREALTGSLDTIGHTLDALSDGVTAEIARRLGVPAARVVAGAGSGALLQQFLAAHCTPGTTVVHTAPSFAMYPLLIRNTGATAVAVPDGPDGSDLAGVAKAVTDDTRVVVLCNPDNPTGEVLGTAAVQQLLDDLPPRVLLLVDEAYREFADPDAVADVLGLAAHDDRVVVVRTFSKSHGLLGLRVGYLVAAERVTAPIRPSTPFYRVPTLGQAAALAAMDAEDRMREQCRAVAAERDRVRDGLLALGFDVPPSGGNFVWVRLGGRSRAFVEHLAAAGIAVRDQDGLGVRVSTGLPPANDAVLAAAAGFDPAPHGTAP